MCHRSKNPYRIWKAVTILKYLKAPWGKLSYFKIVSEQSSKIPPSLDYFKRQHQCNRIDFWTFFLGWRKGSKEKRFEDVFGHVFKFPGKFCHWQISQNGGTGAILLQRIFLRHALELPQIWSWNKNNFFFLICISIARETRIGL